MNNSDRSRTVGKLLSAIVLVGWAISSLGAVPNSLIGQTVALSEIPTDQLIVKYKPSAMALNVFDPASAAQTRRLSDAAGVSLTYAREMSGDAHVVRLPGRTPLKDVQAITDRLSALPEVEYAEPDAIMAHTLTPNDPQYSNQWHYFAPSSGNRQCPGCLGYHHRFASIVVAVIDTGITNHADLSGRTISGYDFIADVTIANDGNGRDSDPSDPGDWVAENECYAGSPARNSSWHGTHTAGTIGAASNNSVGVAGVNWNSKILPVRVLGKCGGYLSDIADGMRWSAGLTVSGVPDNANPAKVINLSLGGSGSCNAPWQSAIDAVTAAGTTVVVSAGNSNADASGFSPANCNGVITVAATNRYGDRAWYSNYGSKVEISAPGGDTSVTLMESFLLLTRVSRDLVLTPMPTIRAPAWQPRT
jgi:serine protease